jgi:ABC-type multidrug transport system permease subunit
MAGEPPVYRYDATHPDARLALLAVDAALSRGRGAPPPPARHETETAPGARYVDWLVPGVLGMQIMNGCLWGVGFALVEMRARKLLKRFAVTPMRRSHFLLAQAIHRVLVIAVEAVLMVGFAALVFDVKIRGSLVAFALLLIAGTFAFAAIGLVVAARARNTEVAAGLMNVPMLPQMVVSGVFFSSSRFPGWLQPAIHALPLTALVDGLRRVSTEGAALGAVATELSVLLVWGAVALGVALRIFRWL